MRTRKVATARHSRKGPGRAYPAIRDGWPALVSKAVSRCRNVFRLRLMLRQSSAAVATSRAGHRFASPSIIGGPDGSAPATLYRAENIGSVLKGGVNVCQRRLINEVLGPLVTEFIRNFGREDATPIQLGSNVSRLSRVEAIKLIRHTAPCRDGAARQAHRQPVGVGSNPSVLRLHRSPKAHSLRASGDAHVRFRFS
jgi:hypothetical protein